MGGAPQKTAVRPHESESAKGVEWELVAAAMGYVSLVGNLHRRYDSKRIPWTRVTNFVQASYGEENAVFYAPAHGKKVVGRGPFKCYCSDNRARLGFGMRRSPRMRLLDGALGARRQGAGKDRWGSSGIELSVRDP